MSKNGARFTLIFSLYALSAFANTSTTVTNPDIDNGSGLRAAINTANTTGYNASNTIFFSGSFSLSNSSGQNLQPIDVGSSGSLTLNASRSPKLIQN